MFKDSFEHFEYQENEISTSPKKKSNQTILTR